MHLSMLSEASHRQESARRLKSPQPEPLDSKMAFVPAPGSALSSRASSRAPVCLRSSSLHGAAVSRRTAPARAIVRMDIGQSIAEQLTLAKANPTLLSLIAAAGIDPATISGTVFAPTEEAFARLPAGTVEALLANPTNLRMLLSHHIVPTKYTLAQIKGVGWYEGVTGGPLSYECLGPLIRVGGATVLPESSNRECDNGIIHAIDKVVFPKGMSVSRLTDAAPSKSFGDCIAFDTHPPAGNSKQQERARGACIPSTSGGRKAMGLLKQLPFWMYGPPFNAAKQEDFEPISIAQPEGASVDYQLMPPGSVFVEPDALSAAELLPVSGYSKYIGKSKREVGGDAESDYSRLD